MTYVAGLGYPPVLDESRSEVITPAGGAGGRRDRGRCQEEEARPDSHGLRLRAAAHHLRQQKRGRGSGHPGPDLWQAVQGPNLTPSPLREYGLSSVGEGPIWVSKKSASAPDLSPSKQDISWYHASYYLCSILTSGLHSSRSDACTAVLGRYMALMCPQTLCRRCRRSRQDFRRGRRRTAGVTGINFRRQP
jgi:hypothetical protein